MRLDILNRGYRPGIKVLFAIIRVFSGHPVPDAARLVFYRPGFYGDRAKTFTHAAMRGPSAWSVADRELMAAFVSKVNVSAGDMRDVLAAGVSCQQVEDALAVCAAFNTTDRLADAFGFELLSPEGFQAGAKYLLKRGYR
jgi:hypothetical protein